MKTIKISGILTALSPVHHGGNEKTGSTIGFRRIEMITNKGIQEVPYISGNAIRGRLRRLVMKDFLDLVGYREGQRHRFETARLYHFFFSGGNLEKVSSKDSGTLNLEARKTIRYLLPPISVFGSSFLNQAFTGKLKVMNAFPICKELEGITFDPSTVRGADFSFHELMSDTYQTRKDELRAERDEGEQAQQMLVEYEVLIPGTRLTHAFVLEDPTPVEEAFFRRAFRIWENNCYVGGKSNIGLGALRPDYDKTALSALEKEETYLKFVEENRDDIVALLQAIDAQKIDFSSFKKKG